MKILVDKEITPFNEIHKNCLKYTESEDYIDDATDYLFTIYDENNQQIGKVEAYLGDNKAGLQITRLKQKEKTLQSEVLSSVINYIWNYVSINHCVLAIHIWIEGSGIEDFTLLRLGFVGQGALMSLGSKLFTLLNPDYEDIVYEKKFDQETKETLTTIYDIQQRKKITQQKEIENMLNNDLRVLDSSEAKFFSEEELDWRQKSIELYQECLKALGDEDIPKNRR